MRARAIRSRDAKERSIHAARSSSRASPTLPNLMRALRRAWATDSPLNSRSSRSNSRGEFPQRLRYSVRVPSGSSPRSGTRGPYPPIPFAWIRT